MWHASYTDRQAERNRAVDTFGFGVVFSDATMAGIAIIAAGRADLCLLARAPFTGDTS